MSEPIRKVFTAAVVKDAALTDREICVIASDPTPDRVGDIMVPSGCRLERFNENPIVLANHDPTKPIGTARATIKNNRVEALITFAPPRISQVADEFCGLAKAGVLNAVSVGFNPVDCDPIRGGGVQYNEWELFELSIVTIPANPNALVIERSFSGARNKRTAQIYAPDLTAQQRRERDIRTRVRAEGMMQLSDDGWRAFLAAEYPGLSERAALHEYIDRKRFMTPHERFIEARRKSDFAKRYARVDALRLEIRAKMPDLASAAYQGKTLHEELGLEQARQRWVL